MANKNTTRRHIMKTRKLFSVLALIAIITALTFTACPHDAGDNNGGGVDNNNNNPDNGGGTITGGKDGATIIPPVIGAPAGVTDFSYIWRYINGSYSYVHINTYIPNSSVTVSGGNATLKLGVPKSEYLETWSSSGTFTVNPSDAKFSEAFGSFYTSDGKYGLTLNADVNAVTAVFLLYADKEVTITGQYIYSNYIDYYNMAMKAGWNYVIEEENGTTYTYTSSTSLPSGFSWQIIAYDLTSGDFTYDVIGGAKIIITNYTGIGGAVNIPSVIDGKPVTSIGNYVFYGCTSLTSVSIPSSITYIGYSAFENCTYLFSITIPSSVTYIGEDAFYGCTYLTSVTFAAGSNIPSANFGNNAFPEGSYGGGDTLKTAYSTGKAGTYTRAAGGSTWTKQ
jgi:hypothetical protein